MQVDYILPDGALKESFELADGLTLNQAACTLFPDTSGKFPAPVIALVGDQPALRELGDWDYPLYGKDTRIQFRQLVQGGGGGGGSNPAQMIFQIAIIALAAAATWYIGGTGAFAGISALGFGSVAGAVAGAGVLMLGTMLMSAIFPANMPSLPSGQYGARDAEAASPTYNINSSGNQARLYQPEPEGFGRMRIKPDFVANTWMQYVNNDQIGYFVYGIGRGHYDVESLQFGETVFWKNGHFVADSGYVDESGSTYSVSPGYTLQAGSGWCSPVAAVAGGTESGTITITLSFPAGLASYYWMPQSGYWHDYYDYEWGSSREWVVVPAHWEMAQHTATVRIQARMIDSRGNPLGSWIDQGTSSWTEKTTAAFERTITLKAGWGRWEIRASNESTVYNDGMARERVVLSGISSVSASIALQFIEPGQAVTIFPDNISSSNEVSGQELFAPNQEDYIGAVGPYTTNAADTQTTKLYFDFTFPQGLGTYDNQGNFREYEVKWQIDCQRIDDFGNELGSWYTLGSLSLRKATRTPQRLTYTYSVQSGRYRVRVRRTSDTASGNGRTMDVLCWGALRAELPGTYTYPISCIAFSIKANNTLSQSASREFSIIATRKLPLYNRQTKTWSEEVATRSWAAAISHVCKSEWGGRLKDHNIDLDTLWTIDEKLAARGWRYDAYVDGPYLVWTLLSEMCQSQLVVPRLVGSVLSFVLDGPDRPPTFALTPRNIVRNSFSVNYVTWGEDTPDDVVLDYLDSAAGFAQRDVTAALPESESMEPTSLSILGITDREHAFRVAVACAAHNRWQRIKVECQTEMLGRIINRGDICTVAHPRFKNTASGAVDSWDEARLAIRIRQDMTRALPEGWTGTGAGLYVAFTQPDGSLWGPCKLAGIESGWLLLESGDYSTLLLQGAGSPFAWLADGLSGQPTAYTIYESHAYQRLMTVVSVSSQDMVHYQLKLANYDNRIYQYAGLQAPAWQGRGQLPQDKLELPANFRGIVESQTQIRLVWQQVAGATVYDVALSSDGVSWWNVGSTSATEYSVQVSSGAAYARVRARSDTGSSAWATWSADTRLLPPAKPSLTLASPYVGGNAQITWPTVSSAERYNVSLRQSNVVFYSAKTADASFAVTPEIQTGGPYREMVLSVVAVNATGASHEASLDLSDPAPAAVTDAKVDISRSGENFAITLSRVTAGADDEEQNGYVLLKGDTPGFTVANYSELRELRSLPYTWDNLAAGTHYFRMAVRDSFFSLTRRLAELNFSAVFTVHLTPDESAPSPDTPSEETSNG